MKILCLSHIHRRNEMLPGLKLFVSSACSLSETVTIIWHAICPNDPAKNNVLLPNLSISGTLTKVIIKIITPTPIVEN